MNKNLKGIDISEFNGDIDFKKVKNEVDFVYIRATYGRYGIDKKFRTYAKACIENNIPVGFYYYSYATNVEDSITEVDHFLEAVFEFKNNITFPLCIDMEDSDGYKQKNGNPSKEVLTDIVIKACEKIAEKNFIPIIYACEDWFKNKLDSEKLGSYLKWLAFWNVSEEKIDKTKNAIWQYSSKGKINGIKTDVDLDYSFVDFIKLKEYTENVSRINFIKSKTLLSDIILQYFSCYKHGNELISKLYSGLKDSDKIVYKELNIEGKKKEVKKYFNFEQKTIDYLSCFIYSDDTFTLLYNAITGKTFEIKE